MPPKKRNLLAEVAAKGNELETLKVLRDELANKFPEMSPGVVPQFAKMFMDLNERITELEPKKFDTGVDNDDLRKQLDVLLRDSEDDGDSEPA